MPKEPDYNLPWVRGWEYICQEGQDYILKQRDQRGWTREDVHDMTEGSLDPNTQGLIEGDYGGGQIPDLDDLVCYAILFDTSPGKLLDDILEQKGRQLLAEDDPEPAP